MLYVKTLLICATAMSLMRIGYYGMKEDLGEVFINVCNAVAFGISVYIMFNQ